jgi:predicted Zn-dependent protease
MRAGAAIKRNSGGRRIAGLCLGLAAMTLAGCATFERIGEPPSASQLPDVAPRAASVDSAETLEHKRLVALYGGEYQAPALRRFVNDILAKLAPASETPSQVYRATLLNTPIVNAFALPTGNIYVTRGLLALANDSSELAAVMAHEIGHVTSRHSSLRAEEEKRAAVIQQAAAVIQSKQKGEEVQATSKVSIASFSRQQENDADQIGVKVISRAGFDPYGAARFLSSLGRATALRAALLSPRSSGKPDILATHPATPERIALVTATARQIGAPGLGASDRASYLAAIDGVAYGDDPSEGFIRGPRFMHPRLGFAFTAPDGFVLDNSAKAVLGVKGGGEEALRLDSVRAPSGQSLTDYIASGWVDGLIASSVESLEVGGLPAVTAIARAGEWNFRIAVVQLDNDFYRLMFAVRALNEDTDRRFRASIGSFHRASAAETAKARSLKIAIVAAGSGDTPASMAQRMVTPDRPLEYFLLLNGLEPGAALKPGERYKLVVE